MSPPGEQLADLRAYVRQHLAPHKTPAEIVFIAEIPRTGLEELKKKELIQRLSSPRSVFSVCRLGLDRSGCDV